MRVRALAVLSATLLLAACKKSDSPLTPIPRAHLKPPTAGPVIPVAELRAGLRDAYRLRPDRRFLLAFGEVRRLAAREPGPPGTPAAAVFSDGKWTVQLDELKLGSLPELPDFPDYFALLVAQAHSAIPMSSAARLTTSPSPETKAFLMPGLRDALRSTETSWREGRFPREAARCFARLAFQMADRLEVAPVVQARALALLAVTRAREARAGVEEEILLAHALGYTRHAETLARGLPPGSPLRLFEALEDEALWQQASKPSSSEESRYLALRRTTEVGDLSRWKEARARFFPGNSSPAVIATGLDLSLPRQVELAEKSEIISEALPRAVLRELAADRPSRADIGPDATGELESTLASAAGTAKGALWDAATLTAYYEALLEASLDMPNPGPWAATSLGMKLLELTSDNKNLTPEQADDGIGAPLIVGRMKNKLRKGRSAYPQIVQEVRALVRRLDSRPAHRAALAYFSHYSLLDVRAAEDLHRSLMQVLGNASPKLRADSALYLGDWTVVEGLMGAPQTTAPQASVIAWDWYNSHSEPDRLDRQYRHLTERFPGDWDITSFYVDFLREQKKYREACAVVEAWLRQNPNPRTPGYFHAHIRLAHNYVLAHEFEKGLKLLEGMNESEWFQQTIRKRGIAECLAGLGRLPEAEKAYRETIRAVPGDPDDVRELIRILWAQGRDKEAAEALANPAYSLSWWETCNCLSDDLAQTFLNLPAERLTSAVDAIVKQPGLLRYYRCAPGGFAKAGRWEDALRVASQFRPSGSERMDFLILQYEYMKSWKGREAAATWLKKEIPAGQMNPLSIKALYTKNDDLLWDVIAAPEVELNNHPEWVWLFRATAFALRGSEGDPHRTEILAYFGKDKPDPYHVMGRYLVGLASDSEMTALATTPQRISEVSYYLGARAQGLGRLRDACEWYRVSAERQEQTSPSALALYTLGEWTKTGQGIWKVEAEKRRN